MSNRKDWHRVMRLLVLAGAVACLGACGRRAPAPVGAEREPALRLIASVPAEKARDCAVIGERVFVAQNFEGMIELDVSDARSPRVVRTYGAETVQPLDVAAGNGDELWIADRFRGFALWLAGQHGEAATSVSSLALPGIATHIEPFGGGLAGYAAVACGGEGLVIVDARNREAPRIAGRMQTAVDYSRWVTTWHDVVFLADNFDGGLKVVRVAGDGVPSLLFQASMRGFSESVVVRDGILYSGWRNYGTRLLALEDGLLGATEQESPTHVRLLCNVYCPADRVHDVLPMGRYFAVANDENGVDLYDASDTSLPVLVSSHDTDEAVMGLALVDGLIYAAAWGQGVLVLEAEGARAAR